MPTQPVDPDQPDENVDRPQAGDTTRPFDGWSEYSPGPPPGPGYPDSPIYPGVDPYYGNVSSPSGLFHPKTGTSLRAIMALGLVASTILLVLLGIILRIPPNEMVQYLAPITPLAGAAIGYWYGAERQ
jgi:hypothetical protein